MADGRKKVSYLTSMAVGLAGTLVAAQMAKSELQSRKLHHSIDPKNPVSAVTLLPDLTHCHCRIRVYRPKGRVVSPMSSAIRKKWSAVIKEARDKREKMEKQLAEQMERERQAEQASSKSDNTSAMCVDGESEERLPSSPTTTMMTLSEHSSSIADNESLPIGTEMKQYHSLACDDDSEMRMDDSMLIAEESRDHDPSHSADSSKPPAKKKTTKQQPSDSMVRRLSVSGGRFLYGVASSAAEFISTAVTQSLDPRAEMSAYPASPETCDFPPELRELAIYDFDRFLTRVLRRYEKDCCCDLSEKDKHTTGDDSEMRSKRTADRIGDDLMPSKVGKKAMTSAESDDGSMLFSDWNPHWEHCEIYIHHDCMYIGGIGGRGKKKSRSGDSLSSSSSSDQSDRQRGSMRKNMDPSVGDFVCLPLRNVVVSGLFVEKSQARFIHNLDTYFTVFDSQANALLCQYLSPDRLPQICTMPILVSHCNVKVLGVDTAVPIPEEFRDGMIVLKDEGSKQGDDADSSVVPLPKLSEAQTKLAQLMKVDRFATFEVKIPEAFQACPLLFLADYCVASRRRCVIPARSSIPSAVGSVPASYFPVSASALSSSSSAMSTTTATTRGRVLDLTEDDTEYDSPGRREGIEERLMGEESDSMSIREADEWCEVWPRPSAAASTLESGDFDTQLISSSMDAFGSSPQTLSASELRVLALDIDYNSKRQAALMDTMIAEISKALRSDGFRTPDTENHVKHFRNRLNSLLKEEYRSMEGSPSLEPKGSPKDRPLPPLSNADKLSSDDSPSQKALVVRCESEAKRKSPEMKAQSDPVLHGWQELNETVRRRRNFLDVSQKPHSVSPMIFECSKEASWLCDQIYSLNKPEIVARDAEFDADLQKKKGKQKKKESQPGESSSSSMRMVNEEKSEDVEMKSKEKEKDSDDSKPSAAQSQSSSSSMVSDVFGALPSISSFFPSSVPKSMDTVTIESEFNRESLRLREYGYELLNYVSLAKGRSLSWMICRSYAMPNVLHLVFKGTTSPIDALVNMGSVPLKVDSLGCSVYSGMYAALQTSMDDITGALEHYMSDSYCLSVPFPTNGRSSKEMSDAMTFDNPMRYRLKRMDHGGITEEEEESDDDDDGEDEDMHGPGYNGDSRVRRVRGAVKINQCVISGHSLGGGYAQLCVAHLYSTGKFVFQTMPEDPSMVDDPCPSLSSSLLSSSSSSSSLPLSVTDVSSSSSSSPAKKKRDRRRWKSIRKRLKKNPMNVELICLTFGAPLVFCKSLQKSYLFEELQRCCVNYVYQFDPVPRLQNGLSKENKEKIIVSLVDKHLITIPMADYVFSFSPAVKFILDKCNELDWVWNNYFCIPDTCVLLFDQDSPKPIDSGNSGVTCFIRPSKGTHLRMDPTKVLHRLQPQNAHCCFPIEVLRDHKMIHYASKLLFGDYF